MRHIPSSKYKGLPCSYVGTGCAYERITGRIFNESLPKGLHSDGYLPLREENKYIRPNLPVKKYGLTAISG